VGSQVKIPKDNENPIATAEAETTPTNIVKQPTNIDTDNFPKEIFTIHILLHL